MIYAIRHNKVNRQLFKANEDSLTSAIFERLRYLPAELMHQIIEGALYQTIPNLDLSKTTSVEYWPSWSAKDTQNTYSVIPDVFIRTENQDIIIEAKRYDKKQQNKDQWKNEVQAYRNEYLEDDKELIFIALGGLHSTDTSVILVQQSEYTVYKCDWGRLLKAIKSIKYRIESNSFYTSSNNAILQILEDLVLCFSVYGFSTSDWFNRFSKPAYLNYLSLKSLHSPWKK